jgi:hypothetical protein
MLRRMFEKRSELVWHPDSPGIKILVVRGFWGRLLKPREFATLGEVGEHHKARRQVTAWQQGEASND